MAYDSRRAREEAGNAGLGTNRSAAGKHDSGWLRTLGGCSCVQVSNWDGTRTFDESCVAAARVANFNFDCGPQDTSNVRRTVALTAYGNRTYYRRQFWRGCLTAGWRQFLN